MFYGLDSELRSIISLNPTVHINYCMKALNMNETF